MTMPDVPDAISSVSLLNALRERRSRRFAPGLRLNGGPLAFESRRPPAPLSLAEEATLAFAANGVTGPVLSELPFQTGDRPDAGGGHIMVHFVGRTVASGDAMHLATVFVVNDEGAWMLRRPQDVPRDQVGALVDLAKANRFVELYERMRVRIADRRVDLPRGLPYLAPFNTWSANLPGTTYFVPIAELTVLYINVLLSFFDEEWRFFFVDDHHGHQPAGIAGFGRSQGGHLEDDPRNGRVGTVGLMEAWIREFGAVEIGGIVQNLGLTTTAMGLGGFPHFAGYPGAWPEALGFRVVQLPFSRTIGAAASPESDPMLVPTPVGLEHGGRTLIQPFCPPYYRDMEAAVLAFIDYKYAEGRGTFRDGGAATAWKDGRAVQSGIPRYSEKAVAATIAYCTYIHERYGRFPASSGPFHNLVAYQAHHLDPDFYTEFYRPGTLAATHRQHAEVWH
jgi:hypothetical protein